MYTCVDSITPSEVVDAGVAAAALALLSSFFNLIPHALHSEGRGSEGRIVINVIGIIIGWWFVVGHGEEHGEGAGGLAVFSATCAETCHMGLDKDLPHRHMTNSGNWILTVGT